MNNHFIVKRYNITRALQFNKDETACKCVNVGNSTFELRGAQQDQIVGLDDKSVASDLNSWVR